MSQGWKVTITSMSAGVIVSTPSARLLSSPADSQFRVPCSVFRFRVPCSVFRFRSDPRPAFSCMNSSPFEGTESSVGNNEGRPHGDSRTARPGQRKAGRSKRAAGKFVRMYRRYHAWRAPFPLWARVVCDILFWAVLAAAAYVAIGSLCGAVLVAAPLLGILGLASSKEHDDGIDWSDHRMGGQPRNPGPKF